MKVGFLMRVGRMKVGIPIEVGKIGIGKMRVGAS